MDRFIGYILLSVRSLLSERQKHFLDHLQGRRCCLLPGQQIDEPTSADVALWKANKLAFHPGTSARTHGCSSLSHNSRSTPSRMSDESSMSTQTNPDKDYLKTKEHQDRDKTKTSSTHWSSGHKTIPRHLRFETKTLSSQLNNKELFNA